MTNVVSQLGGMAVVLALLAGAWWGLRRRGLLVPAAIRHKQGRLESLERLPLSPHHTLHLVRVGNAALLVAASPGGCSLLQSTSLPAPDREERL